MFIYLWNKTWPYKALVLTQATLRFVCTAQPGRLGVR